MPEPGTPEWERGRQLAIKYLNWPNPPKQPSEAAIRRAQEIWAELFNKS